MKCRLKKMSYEEYEVARKIERLYLKMKFRGWGNKQTDTIRKAK